MWRRAAEELENLTSTSSLSPEHLAKAQKLLAQAKEQWELRGESGL